MCCGHCSLGFGEREVRGWAERSRVGRRLASRFVAGTTVEDAVAACERVNAQGMAVSLDSLGESVTLEAEARAAAEVYHEAAGCDRGAGAECECEREADADGDGPRTRRWRRRLWARWWSMRRG